MFVFYHNGNTCNRYWFVIFWTEIDHCGFFLSKNPKEIKLPNNCHNFQLGRNYDVSLKTTNQTLQKSFE